MDWTLLIENIRERTTDGMIKTLPPTTRMEIREAELKLGVKFPNELIQFLLLSNGLEEYMIHPKSNELILIENIIWPVSWIVSQTIGHYDFLIDAGVTCADKCLFFADNGCGEHFGYKFSKAMEDTTVYIYYPIRNEYKRVATNMMEWAENWFSGKILT